jgi:hypothetical protein
VALNPLVERLRDVLGAVGSESAQPEKATRAVTAQDRETGSYMAKLLSEFDPGAVDFLETNQAALRLFFTGESWTQFEKLVQSYAFGEAQTRLEQALKEPAA